LPQNEQIREKGYDILLMSEEVDDFMIRTLRSYEEKQFCDVTGSDLGLETEEEKKESDAKEESEKDTLDFIKDALGDKVEKVRLSRKLKSHAVCLTTDGEISLEMEKYFASVPGTDMEDIPKAKRVLEINADHPVYQVLKDTIATDKDKAKTMAEVMYGQALLIAGMPIDDVLDYSDKVFGLF
jgi:molecular chaperone HtpG